MARALGLEGGCLWRTMKAEEKVSWQFELKDATPAAMRVQAGESINGLLCNVPNGQTTKETLLIQCGRGRLGFAPDEYRDRVKLAAGLFGRGRIEGEIVSVGAALIVKLRYVTQVDEQASAS